ncbi:transcriptional regulator MetR [Streptococcus troglodytae]|uniref:Transcriptional regulator MetR n=2 Tax=Streptococcus troglodytae TaxID=1111760 RepID=A0A1L7LJW7_9STRE|nr:transcriptional regulator MetR [Streptococcus troglodytae]
MEDFLAFKSIANADYHLHFTSDIMNAVEGKPPHKIIRPLADSSAKMDYYLIFKKENQERLSLF